MGIIHCPSDFIESGAVEAICDRLPFPVLGTNTLLNSSSLGVMDHMLLTVCVLTSDHVNFAVSLSDPLPQSPARALSKMYVEAENRLSRRPAFMLLYCGTFGLCALGEAVVSTLDEFSDRVPIFGTMAAEFGSGSQTPRIIFNVAAYSDRAAVVLVEGQVTPVFTVHNVPLWRGIQQRAIVTKSRENVISEINGLPAVEFLDSIGLCWYGQITGHMTIPIFVDRGEGGPPVVRTIFSQDDSGSIYLTGWAPPGSTLGFGTLDEREVLQLAASVGLSTRSLYSNLFYVVSCLSRNFILGLNYLAEMERLHSAAERSLHYVFTYAGGEFCPVAEPDGSLKTLFHNMSLVTLAF